MTDTTAAGQGRLPLLRVLSFATTAMPLNSIVIAFAVFLPQFFASHVGVPLARVGAIFGIVRLLDLAVDFILGLLMDRTRTPMGRYRPWMVLGAPIVMAASYFLFEAQPGVGEIYLIGWLLVMYLGLSILALSHTAWASTLATSYNERSRLFGAMTGVGVLGAVLVLLVPIALGREGSTGGHDVNAIGWMIIVLAPLAVALVTIVTPERVSPEVEGARFRLRDYWELISRPAMVRVLIADLCLTLGPGWMSALYFYFFMQSRGFTRPEASAQLLIYIAAGLVGAPLMGRLATRVSKHRATLVACTVYSLMLPLIVFLPRGNMLAMAPAMFILGFMAAGFNVLTRAMTADIADEVRLEQGKERTGLLFAITTLTGKIAGAMSITLTFFVLSQVGFDGREGVTNSAAAVRGLERVYLSGPVIFVMLGGLAFIGYKLTAERHAEIRVALDARDAEEAPVIHTLSAD